MIYVAGSHNSKGKMLEVCQALKSEGFDVHYPFEFESCSEEIVLKDIRAIWKSSVVVRVVDGNSSEGASHEVHEAMLCNIPVFLLNLTGKDLDPWTKFFSDREVRSLGELIQVLKSGENKALLH